MTSFLGRLSAVSSVLAGVGSVSIALIILAQILARGLSVALPSTDEFAAWAMAAAVFLALPGAFYHGSHIRVLLAVDRLPAAARRMALRLGNGVSLAIMATGSWHVLTYVMESYQFNEMSQGVLALPLWIPQMSMVVGMWMSLPFLLVLTITGDEACVPGEPSNVA